jgi:hypothetical protein
MANPVKGEAAVTIDGVEYTLRFTMESMVQISRRYGNRGVLGIFNDLLSSPDGPPPEMERLIFWQALRHHHKDITEEQAGDILWSAKLNHRGVEILSAAIATAFPGRDGDADPQTPPTGTGTH